MTALLEPQDALLMAKRGRPSKQRPDSPVRVYDDLVYKINFILARYKKRGAPMSQAEFLSPKIQADVEAEYDHEFEEARREREAEKRNRKRP